MSVLAEEIRAAINRHSRENRSNTPDYILAEFMLDTLDSFERAVNRREQRLPRGVFSHEMLTAMMSPKEPQGATEARLADAITRGLADGSIKEDTEYKR